MGSTALAAATKRVGSTALAAAAKGQAAQPLPPPPRARQQGFAAAVTKGVGSTAAATGMGVRLDGAHEEFCTGDKAMRRGRQ